MASFTEIFKELAQKVLNGLVRRELDPSKFNDPLAALTSWKPLKPGGASFQTKVLSKVDSQRIEYQASTGYNAFCLIFFAIGVGVFFLVQTTIYNDGLQNFKIHFDVLMFLPLFFCVVSAGMWWIGKKVNYFDLSSNSFGKGSESNSQKLCNLTEIAAIQILPERIRTKNSSYTSYEFNLILKDGSRLSVVDHGDLGVIHQDVAEIQRFLGRRIPVFDATLPQYYIEKKLIA